MKYRSAAFARLSAHALAGDGSTHFPARGVDADALLGTAALLYLLRFSGDIVTAEQTLVAGVVPPKERVTKILCLLCRVAGKAVRGSVVGRDGTHLGLGICALKR